MLSLKVVIYFQRAFLGGSLPQSRMIHHFSDEIDFADSHKKSIQQRCYQVVGSVFKPSSPGASWWWEDRKHQREKSFPVDLAREAMKIQVRRTCRRWFVAGFLSFASCS